MTKKTLIKTVAAVTLSSIIVAALLGLGLWFNIIKDAWWVGRVLLTCLTLVVAGILLFNSINAITSGNKIGLIAGVLIVVSAVLYLVLIWGINIPGNFIEIYNYVVVIVSSASIFFNIIIANYVSMGKSLLILQIIYYLIFAYILVTVDALILGNSTLIKNYWMIFGAAIIVAFTLFIILTVKKKTLLQAVTEDRVGEGYVKITKTEYEGLKAEIARLKQLVGEDKNK